MPLTIAIVGTGPTGLYALRALATPDRDLRAEAPSEPMEIWLFEKGDEAGVGMPYSDETADKTMLANIASIEIPPVTQSYLDWLEAQSGAVLRAHGVDPDEMDERQFTPRLLLGRYYRDEFDKLVHAAEALGHHVEIRERTEVTDIARDGAHLVLTTDKGPVEARFDRVLLATGHVFPDEDEATRRYFPSPWSGLLETDIPAGEVGIMGTSLSGIDAAMAVATQHGRFVRARDGSQSFERWSDDLHITLMSWTGILPEADFYCPIPYEPLAVMTDDALAALPEGEGQLDRVFALFAEELRRADPAYAEKIGLDRLTADSFADAYFADRLAHDPFRWARENLAEVERNKADKRTVAWRYAILRMHEQVETVVEGLDETDRARFDKGLKKVFVDNYAAVPSESIRRLLALRDAGVLRVWGLGQDYDKTVEAERTVITTAQGERRVFDVFIDARGQKPLTAPDLPFPSLRDALVRAGADVIEVDEDYALTESPEFAGRVLLGSIPYLMHDRPFVQGITAAADIGAAMARSVRRDAADVAQARRKRRRVYA